MKHFATWLSIAVCLTAMMIPIKTKAVTAYPGLVEYRQPDGRVVNIMMKGDEFLRWAITEDGYSLLYGHNGALVYAVKSPDGDLIPSKHVATMLKERPVEVTAMLKDIPKGLTFSQEQFRQAELKRMKRQTQMKKASAAPNAATSEKLPVVGERKMLVILVEFADVKFNKSQEDFEKLMNAENYTENGNFGSVRDYYRENSFGKLDLKTDVVGIYTLPRERAYYGGNVGGNDANPQAMAMKAVELADPDVNFSDYDADGDGVVDGVHIIFAGHGEEAGGGEDCIWSHSYVLTGQRDGKILSRYSCSPELRNASGNNTTFIGVICHEIGHVLGAMDFYDTNYSTGGQYQGTGKWDLMASGNWNYSGAMPAHFNPYSKIYDFGWAEAQDGNRAASFTLDAMSDKGFVRIDTKTPGEYFLLEYRGQTGFDRLIPGHGLMVYRASEDLSRLGSNTVNAFHKQQFYPLCANATAELPTSEPSSYGTVDSESAPYPGTLNINELNDMTMPSMMSWNHVPTEFPITSVIENVNDMNVTFDVAGGIDGGAYNFKVADSGTDFISLEWKKDAGAVVMLVWSDTPQFDIPENRDYEAGSKFGENATVAYIGTENEYRHTGLEDMTLYYYKLFTRRNDGSWTSGRSLVAKTQVGVIRKFPFTEDFEMGSLDNSWRQEFIFNAGEWTVKELPKSTERSLCLEAGDKYRSTRVILPKMDFSGRRCAAIQVDLRNFQTTLEVQYRSSETDTWHTLVTVPSMHEAGALSQSIDDFLNAVTRYTIELPNITSEYEVAFMAYYARRGAVTSSLEMCTIDNINVTTDFDAILTTGKPRVGVTTVSIPVDVVCGTATPDEYGIEYSTSGSTWTRIAANDGRCEIVGLTTGSTVKYRGYASAGEEGAIVGETHEVMTLRDFRGEGSADAPILIGDMSEWQMLCNAVNSGNSFDGMFFAFDQSFTLNSYIKILKKFNGIIDGRGNTMTIAVPRYNGLMEKLGTDGVIRNLNLNIPSMTTTDYRSSAYVIYNYGLIENCCLKVDDLKPATRFGGMCSDNLGYVTNCRTDITGYTENGSVGGICWYNESLISYCESRGHVKCNNNATIAGIASVNFYGESQYGKTRHGFIANCVNHATFEMIRVDDKTWSNEIGGIAGNNYGEIRCCVNYGKIIADQNGTIDCTYAGGITAYHSYGDIESCLNRGIVEINGNTQLINAGEIAGYGYIGEVRYSLADGDLPSYSGTDIRAIVGTNNQTGVTGCLYTGDSDDLFGQKASPVAAENLAVLGGEEKDWSIGDGALTLKWQTDGMAAVIDYIRNTTVESAEINWVTWGEALADCSLQWRRRGDTDWNTIDGKPATLNKTFITGLSPATIYECRVALHSQNGSAYGKTETFATPFTSKGTQDDPHYISTYEEMVAFNEMVANGNTFGHQTVRLTRDIDLMGDKGFLWTPMQSRYYRSAGFDGEFDGGGHVIRNMKVNTNRCYAGFFALSEGYVHDLEITDSEIKVNVGASANRYYAGVGGIVGSSTSYSIEYPCLVERCGFKGRITGAAAVGGIVGGAAIQDPVRDCYAIADVVSTYPAEHKNESSFSGGIIGEGNAINSWFVGTITRDQASYSYSIGGISGKAGKKGTNAGSYYSAVATPRLNTSNGETSMSTDDMKQTSFLDKLTKNIWTQTSDINDGLPTFMARGNSRVTTITAGHDERGDVKIEALYTPGLDKAYMEHGIQWYAKRGDGVVYINDISDEETTRYSVTVENSRIASEGINYRAYATEGTDSIFGDWHSFELTVKTPHSTIIDIEQQYDTTAEMKYLIEQGTIGISSARIEYGAADDGNPVSVEIPVDGSAVTLTGLNVNTIYTGRIVVEGANGMLYESNSFIWHQEILTNVDGIRENKPKSHAVYDLKGQELLKDNSIELLEKLPHGIYIINGKIVKK